MQNQKHLILLAFCYFWLDFVACGWFHPEIITSCYFFLFPRNHLFCLLFFFVNRFSSDMWYEGSGCFFIFFFCFVRVAMLCCFNFWLAANQFCYCSFQFKKKKEQIVYQSSIQKYECSHSWRRYFNSVLLFFFAILWMVLYVVVAHLRLLFYFVFYFNWIHAFL